MENNRRGNINGSLGRGSENPRSSRNSSQQQGRSYLVPQRRPLLVPQAHSTPLRPPRFAPRSPEYPPPSPLHFTPRSPEYPPPRPLRFTPRSPEYPPPRPLHFTPRSPEHPPPRPLHFTPRSPEYPPPRPLHFTPRSPEYPPLMSWRFAPSSPEYPPPSHSAPFDFEPSSPSLAAAADPANNNMEEPEQNDREESRDVSQPPAAAASASNRAQAGGHDADGANAETAEEAIRAAIEDMQELNRSLLELLECPTCLEYMSPPMSQCQHGHLLCMGCRARLAQCPLCRASFSGKRNRAMEAVAEKLRYPCRHGCGRQLRLAQRDAHEGNCASRRYRCPAAACAQREPLPLGALLHHFQTTHPAMLKVGFRHDIAVEMNEDQHDDWLVQAGSDLFHLRVDIDLRTWGRELLDMVEQRHTKNLYLYFPQCVAVQVRYIGPKEKASEYIYEVSFVGVHNESNLVYTRQTHSDLENVSLTVRHKDCFNMSLEQVLNFLGNRICVPPVFNLSVAIRTREPSAPAGRPTWTELHVPAPLRRPRQTE
ncbi:E3 ubiquitin-protein ligase sina-like [Maniola hyperantus]|uniref:E3 ubiquitin-protein ligase sina-like n=1 Tax=Aphantopus hyperantus TaxID=2795564 RepID=UPI003749C64E